jgi:Ala-tRNA(Pro) deacylase
MTLVTEQLTRKGIPFEILFHQPTFFARDEAHRLGLPLSEVVKTILIDTRPGHALAVIPSSRHLDMHLVRQAIGPHARLATEAEIQHRFPGYELGALPPLASALDIPIYADPEVMSQNMIVFAVSQSESLRVRTDQVLGGEVTIVPLVQGQAKPELAAVAEEVEPLAAAEAEEESKLLAVSRR